MKLTCEWCGKRFTKPNSRGPNPKYCSNAHRQAAFVAAREERVKQEARQARAELALLRTEVADLRKIKARYDKEHRDDRYDPMG